ncbi:uncharacterized protein LOC132295429 [Cornus florida]|uniref:uncharacterized protein LOC132295429 n=1 Tax=Cornus florida TaxID=4283 RepID=UPI00289E20D9|nr:uncharacterized protein LOC132295429 [Cornus florida]
MAMESGKKVMVAIDENESSYHAFIWVLENLKESINNSNNPLTIFMAQPSPTSNHVFSAALGSARMYCQVSATPEFVNSVREQNKRLSLGLLEKAKAICTSRGVNAETITEIGDPKQAICNAVQKYNISLLVLGDHDIGKIRRALLGSVSNYCVHNASCSVLVVKKPE